MKQLAQFALLSLTSVLPLLGACVQAAAAAPSYCRSEVFGGAAPPGLLGQHQLAKVNSILGKYRADALTARDARDIRQALYDAGLHPGPALDEALGAAGFSAKRLEELAPCPPDAPVESRPSPAGRIIPPPQ